ncbi:MAG: glycosyltransferase family 2 protein [Spirochaetota bacterium]
MASVPTGGGLCPYGWVTRPYGQGACPYGVRTWQPCSKNVSGQIIIKLSAEIKSWIKVSIMSLNFWVIIHFIALSGLVLYGLHRIWILYHWFSEKKKYAPELPPDFYFKENDCPFVTVQLPLYNERFVAERLIDAAANLDWPGKRLEIQVLDDSTDDTPGIVEKRVAYWAVNGVVISVVRRTNREGYKAGALDNGMKTCSGEFIAIFDADFVPPRDFLFRTISFFADKKTGMVQARWGFLNTEHSWLTSVQALLLGPHFRIEHWVRHRRGLFFNFNGTAGVWRRTAIESAGGWQADTVTEDLDLSYRAQMAGWKFRYVDELEVPSELPVRLSAFRCQQQRWAKGSVQTAKKILPLLLKRNFPPAVKLEALAHLLANVCWLLGVIVTLTLYPTILSRTNIGPYQIFRIDAPIFILSSMAIFLYFVLYRRGQNKKIPLSTLLMMPVFTIGLAPGIALSVIKGIFRNGGIFDRTPKFGINGKEKLPRMAFLYSQRSMPYVIMNLILFCYTLLPVYFALQRETWIAIPFLLVFPMGFFFVMCKDVKEIFENYFSKTSGI